ncbi:MAG: hypothetical protein KDC12_07520 [Flavobacteriales bacterium]|nr:hypothetical protein [Flavobacteriales bacterium]
MNRILLVAFVLISAAACGQRNEDMETVFNHERSVGAFIGFGAKFTELQGQPAMLNGLEFNLVIGRALNLGVVGYGLSTEVLNHDVVAAGDHYHFSMGYGGLNIEPVFFSRKMIHFTTPIIIGAGAVTQSESSYLSWNYENYEWSADDPYRSDSFLFLEPGINAEVNLFKFMRFTAGASYRLISDVQIPGVSQKQTEGLSAHVGLRLGWF